MKQIGLLSLLLIGFGLFAQEQYRDTIKLKEVSIHAGRNLFEAQRIDSLALEDPTNLDLGEMLQKQSHLFVKSFGIGSITSVSMRGTGSAHTRVFWNGMQLNSVTHGMLDLSLFPTLFMDEVQVNYGLSSLKQSSGGLGGAINLNNKVNFLNKHNVKFSQSFGSFGQKTSTAKLQFGTEKWQSITRFFWREAENDFEYKDLTLEGFPTTKAKNTSLHQKGLMQSLHYRIKENQVIEGNLWLYHSDRNLPALMSLRNNVENQIDESMRLMLNYNYYGNDWVLKYSISSSIDRLIYRNDRASVNDSTLTRGIFNRMEFNKTWSKKVKQTTQANFNFQDASSGANSEVRNRKTVSIYNKINYEATKRMTVNAAFRQEWILDEANLFMPAIDVNYGLLKGRSLNLFFKIGRNYNFPSLNDLYTQPFGNEDLKAEESQSLDLGIARLFKIKKLEIFSKLTAFAANIENYIQWQPTAFGFWRPVNLEAVKTRGLEGELSVKQNDAKLKKTLTLNYTYTNSINQNRIHEFDESNGKQLIYIPENQFNFQLDLAYKDWRLMSSCNFVGHRYTSSDNERFVPAYTTTDLTLSKNMNFKTHNMELSVSVLNVFDTEYQTIEWRPMPNRNYLLRLTYHLSK
tara:strand:+ start:923 stop:2812 length:1890 start_codon:yes stop_codon:yes gene_type:complete